MGTHLHWSHQRTTGVSRIQCNLSHHRPLLKNDYRNLHQYGVNHYRDGMNLFGLPQKIISDRRPQFTAQFRKDLLGLWATFWPPTIFKWTVRLNKWTKRYNSIYGYLWTINSLIGPSGLLVPSFHTMTISNPLPVLHPLQKASIHGNKPTMRSEESINDWVHRTYKEGLWRKRSSFEIIKWNNEKGLWQKEGRLGEV